MNITILYSQPTRRAKKSQYLITDEDTVSSAQKISDALGTKGATVTLTSLSEDHIEDTIGSLHADLVINLIDWTGEDFPLSLIAMDALTKQGIAFAGATKENFLLTDKVRMKQALDRLGVPTPRWQLFTTGTEPILSTFRYPVIVKLSREHCSIGIEKSSFVTRSDDMRAVVQDRLKRFHQDVFAEEFISGREFQITVYEEHGLPVVLAPAEITYQASDAPEFLTFSERWHENDSDYMRSNTILAVLTEKQTQLFRTIAARVFTSLGFHDFTRIDARLRGDHELFILEANPNPGLDGDEQYSMTISAKAAGLTFPDFLWKIVESALSRV